MRCTRRGLARLAASKREHGRPLAHVRRTARPLTWVSGCVDKNSGMSAASLPACTLLSFCSIVTLASGS